VPPVVLPKSPRARLIAKHDGLTTGKNFEIVERAVVGRGGASPGQVDVDLAAMPEAAYVSAHHAEIRYEHDHGWTIRDLGSQNGSFVRHAGTTAFQRMVGEEVLRDGDEVAFGNARFEFQAV
jgi:pSer/pThr/pTyr-binding forkhead associated (FHA) protein